jgi:uncharacterized protein
MVSKGRRRPKPEIGSEIRPISLAAARRLALRRQHLTTPPPKQASADAILSLVADLGYVQYDPVSIVAPNHLLTFWSRLPAFDPSELERLLWKEKRLFEHWLPFAAIVRTEDYPLYHWLMRRYPESLTSAWGRQRDRAREFLTRNRSLRQRLLAQLEDGPRTVAQFSEYATTRRSGEDWNARTDLDEMLYHLLMRGEVMVVGHEGARNLWGLTESFLPADVERTEMTVDEFEAATALRALRALGTATPKEIRFYYLRGQHPDLPGALQRLAQKGRVTRVTLEGAKAREERYIRTEDLAFLDELAQKDAEPGMWLLPPFDNLLANTDLTHRLFGFRYVREQFFAPAKRKYGTYVLPILWGDRFIGRIDPKLDRSTGTLHIQAIHAEPDAPKGPAVASALRETIDRLATFVGAGKVVLPTRRPRGW